MRNLKYSEAIFESFYQLLEKDSDVVIIGQGLWSPWYVGATMTDLEKKFGKEWMDKQNWVKKQRN